MEPWETNRRTEVLDTYTDLYIDTYTIEYIHFRTHSLRGRWQIHIAFEALPSSGFSGKCQVAGGGKKSAVTVLCEVLHVGRPLRHTPHREYAGAERTC